MAALGLHCFVWAFSSRGQRGLLCRGARASHYGGLSCCWALALGTWASVVAAQELSSCSAQALELRLSSGWHTGLVAPWHVGSSYTRAGIHVPCIGRRILNHWATREVPTYGPLWWRTFVKPEHRYQRHVKKWYKQMRELLDEKSNASTFYPRTAPPGAGRLCSTCWFENLHWGILLPGWHRQIALPAPPLCISSGKINPSYLPLRDVSRVTWTNIL